MAIFLNSSELVELVNCHLIDNELSQKDFAKATGISTSYLCDFLQGKRRPGPTILKALGFEEQPYFKKTRA